MPTGQGLLYNSWLSQAIPVRRMHEVKWDSDGDIEARPVYYSQGLQERQFRQREGMHEKLVRSLLQLASMSYCELEPDLLDTWHCTVAVNDM